jgi:hypothetical protein
MMILLNILYAAFLFFVFLCLLFFPIGLVVWVVRRWYATHRLSSLPWRRRRAMLGLALLWSAAFTKLAKWKKISGITVLLSLLLVVFLAWLKAALYVDSDEHITIIHLRAGRYGWLMDGCPKPLDVERYMGESSSITTWAYTNALAVNDHTYHGLFAWRDHGGTITYVITTTGEILSLNGSEIRFVEGP